MKAIFRTKLFDQSRLKAAGLESIWVTRRRSWGVQKKPMRRKTSASMSFRGCWEEWSRRAPRCGRPSATVKMNCGNCERSERRATKGRKGQLISTHTHIWVLNSPLINYLSIACSIACCNILCVFLGLSSWRRRWPYSKKRSTIWMTCWKANRGKSDTWSSRWDEHVWLYKANTLSPSSLRRDRSLSVSMFARL